VPSAASTPCAAACGAAGGGAVVDVAAVEPVGDEQPATNTAASAMAINLFDFINVSMTAHRVRGDDIAKSGRGVSPHKPSPSPTPGGVRCPRDHAAPSTDKPATPPVGP